MGRKYRHKISGYNVYMPKHASERWHKKGGSKGKPTSKKVRGMKFQKWEGYRIYMNKEAHKYFEGEGGI